MGHEAKPSLSRASASFRLRNPSLNTLRLRRIFDVFDANRDGVITLLELSRALQRLGLEADPSELDSAVRSHIRPGNPGLEFEDFEALHRSLGDSIFGAESGSESESESESEFEMKEAFNVFDEDGDGFISAVELHTVLGKLGLQEGEEMESVHQMICSVDRDRDGRVDFGEFKEMMQRVSVPSA